MNSLGKIYNYTIDFNESIFSNINFLIRDCLCENSNDELHKWIILCKRKLLYSFAHSIIDSPNSCNIPNIIGTHINEKSEIKVKKDKLTLMKILTLKRLKSISNRTMLLNYPIFGKLRKILLF